MTDWAAIVIMMNRLQGLDVSVSQARVFCSLMNAGIVAEDKLVWCLHVDKREWCGPEMVHFHLETEESPQKPAKTRKKPQETAKNPQK